MRLDLNLSAELVFYCCLLKLRLEEDFQPHDVFALFFPRQVNVAELSFPQRTSDVKIIQSPSV